MGDTFLKFTFKSNLLYIGERTKKGTFKPAISPIGSKYTRKQSGQEALPLPYSTITGALKAYLGEDKEIHAIGKITRFMREYVAIAPYDTALNTAKLPITIECLSDVKGEIYVKKTDDFNSLSLLDNVGMEGFRIGGLKSRGFGLCTITSATEIIPKVIEKESKFLSRIFFDDEILGQFGMRKEDVIKPYFGYLFKKTSIFDGYYQKSIFENTILRNAYDFLVEV